jgi:hypothetical protein
MTRASSNRNVAIFAFIAGATAVALAALAASSKGAQARKALANLGRRTKGKARLLAGRGTRAWEAFKEDPADLHPDSGQDLRGKAAGVWQDAQDNTQAMGVVDLASDPGKP